MVDNKVRFISKYVTLKTVKLYRLQIKEYFKVEIN